jgi:hypothetical protein
MFQQNFSPPVSTQTGLNKFSTFFQKKNQKIQENPEANFIEVSKIKKNIWRVN